MSTHSLPTKGFMHVNLAQWMVPLVGNIRNYWDWKQSPRMPSGVATISYFSLSLVFIADEMKSSKLAIKQLSFLWSSCQVMILFFLSLRDGLCSTVSIPSWRTQWRSISAASTAVFPVGNLPTPLRLPLTNTAWTRELCKHQILLY